MALMLDIPFPSKDEGLAATLRGTIGETAIDFSALPEASQKYLAQAGLTHVLSNRVASTVTGEIRKAIVAGTERNASDAITAEIKSWREDHEGEARDLHAKAFGEWYNAVMSGDVEARERADTVLTEGDAKKLAAADTIEAFMGGSDAWEKGKNGKVNGQAKARKIAAFLASYDAGKFRADVREHYETGLGVYMSRVMGTVDDGADDMFAALDDAGAGNGRRSRRAAE